MMGFNCAVTNQIKWIYPSTATVSSLKPFFSYCLAYYHLWLQELYSATGYTGSSAPLNTSVVSASKPTSRGKSNTLYIAVGASGFGVGLLAVVLVTSVTIHLKRKAKKRLIGTADNSAYGVTELSDNAAYINSRGQDTTEEHDYDYITTGGSE